MEKYLNLASELKKNVKSEGDSSINCSWCVWNGPQRLGEKTGGFRKRKKNREHTHQGITEIGKDTEKCPGYRRRLKKHQLPLVGNSLGENNNNKNYYNYYYHYCYKRTCRIVDLTVPADHAVKLKESEKKDKYLELASELKKTVERWYQLTMISIVISALGTVTKALIQGLEDLEIRGKVETIQTTAFFFLDRPEYWEASWKLEETCCHSNSSQKPSASTGMKNSQKISCNNNNMIWSGNVWKEFRINRKLHHKKYGKLDCGTNSRIITPSRG